MNFAGVDRIFNKVHAVPASEARLKNCDNPGVEVRNAVNPGRYLRLYKKIPRKMIIRGGNLRPH